MNKQGEKTPRAGFDAFVLAASVAEMRAALVGAKVQKVQQPSASEVTLLCFGRAGAQKVLLSADPQRARVHLSRAKFDNPVTPPGFCQVCRKYLDGATVEAVAMPRFDRVVQFEFRASDGERVALIAELMGRNANVFLTSGAGTVRGVLRPIPSESERRLRPGVPYVDPPGYGDRPDPPSVPSAVPPLPPSSDAARWLSETFSGLGPFASREIVTRAGASGTVADALAGLMADVHAERFAPHGILDASGALVGLWAVRPVSIADGQVRAAESIGSVLDDLHAQSGDRAEQAERDGLARAIEREVKWREKEIASSRMTLAEGARADEYEQTGNNLLAALPQLTDVPRGADSVTIADLYADDRRDVEVGLDPKLTLQENAERYFARAQKARDAATYAEGRLDGLAEEIAELGGLAERLADGDETGAIGERFRAIVGDERGVAGTNAAKVKPAEKAFDGHKIRTYTLDGWTVLVGETAEANDYLTTRVASPSDLWLHVRGAPGAHGVVRTQNQPQRVPDAVVRRAAALVAARSGNVKHSQFVAVDVTEKRYVRKPRNAKPGQVIIERERTLDVTPALPT